LNLTLYVDRDLLGEVAVGDGGGHGGDVAHLGRQVTGHAVHGVGEVLPGAGDALHLGLAAELAFGADFAGHAGHFGGEAGELVHHRVDDLGGAEEFACERPTVDLHRHHLRQVALGDGADHAAGFVNRVHQVADQVVHAAYGVLPGAADFADVGALADFP